MPAFIAPLLAGAGRLGASMAAEKAVEAVAAPVMRRFAGDAMARMAARRAAEAAAQQGRMAFARNALAGPDIGALGRIGRAALPQGVGGWAMELLPEVLGSGMLFAALPQDMDVGTKLAAAVQSAALGTGLSAGGRLALATGRQPFLRGRSPKQQLEETRAAANLGGFAGMASGFVELPALRDFDNKQVLQQQEEAIRRGQTLAQPQSPYAVSPFVTSPYG